MGVKRWDLLDDDFDSVSREVAVLNNFIGDIKAAVEAGPDDLKQFIFSGVIPLYYSKFISEDTRPEVPLFA